MNAEVLHAAMVSASMPSPTTIVCAMMDGLETTVKSVSCYDILICDMIKGNESLVENVNSYFLAPLSQNCNMLHFDPNPIPIGYLVTELWRICQC